MNNMHLWYGTRQAQAFCCGNGIFPILFTGIFSDRRVRVNVLMRYFRKVKDNG